MRLLMRFSCSEYHCCLSDWTKSRFSSLDTTTLMYYLLVGISCMAVVRACLPLNPLRISWFSIKLLVFYVAAMLFHNI